MSARAAFLEAAASLLGMPTLWAQKGPDAYDCSGLVTSCLVKVGGADLRYTHNAQALHALTRPISIGNALPGDLAFYGTGPEGITHVAVVDERGGVISADGATSHITSLAVAKANPSHYVRRHPFITFRQDLPWCVVHRFTALDDLDRVTR